MIRVARIIVLAGCIAASAITAGVCAPVRQDPCEAMIKEALKAVDKLKVGETRADVEQSFVPDGGKQIRTITRYTFKRCDYIKIDVKFSIQGVANPWAFSSADVIVHISKPYLEPPDFN